MKRIALIQGKTRRLPGLLCGAVLLSMAPGAAATPGEASGQKAAIALVGAPVEPASEGRPITPAGTLVMDATTGHPAVVPLTVDFVRSTDNDGPDGQGRYLIAINSGYGVQFRSHTNGAQQSLSVVDLNAAPAPRVIQNVYFPTPQSANVGLALSARAAADGSRALYVSGGVQNVIWVFRFTPGAPEPIAPPSPGPKTRVTAPYIDLGALAPTPASARYNGDYAPLYPTGLALSPDGETLFVANDLGDSLAIVSHLGDGTDLSRVGLRRVDLRRGDSRRGDSRPEDGARTIYPYGVALLTSRSGAVEKVYVSCWNDSALAVVDPRHPETPVRRVAVGRHPTAMTLDASRRRLYVVNSDADSVSVVDVRQNKEIERIDLRLTESALPGGSPEGLALSGDGSTLYVANAHSNAIAVVALANGDRRGSKEAGPRKGAESKKAARDDDDEPQNSRLLGFIPTGQYPAAVAVVGQRLVVANGKGTGFENSSMIVNDTGLAPNAPNERFPMIDGDGGQYSGSLISGNLSLIDLPDERALYRYTQQVLRNDGLIGEVSSHLFPGLNPIRHVIYVIKENRTYDQVFGDIEAAGDGTKADGDATLAIFGAGEAARTRGGSPQDITPNQRALALRFGLLDRFFVNSEASADGHNWATAAFSTDFVDKSFRWDYSGRGRTYDYEGFNRLPSIDPLAGEPPFFPRKVTADDVMAFQKRYAPDLNRAPDVAEPGTLYLWDAAKKAGLTYRSYGEFVPTISQADIEALNSNRPKPYPDLSPTVRAFATKRSLEGHHSPTFRYFDLRTPDSMTTESYRAFVESGGRSDPLIAAGNADERFRGYSRLADWLTEFSSYAADLEAGRADRMPNLTILRFPNNHTDGLTAEGPTPQFYVAENDYAVGRLVQAVSHSPYWKSTAILVIEDDSQNGPDHVDMHRSPALVISAYNRPGALVHEFHSTVSMVRTLEVLLGLSPMNQLDAAAPPIAIFGEAADLRPYDTVMPKVALDNLMVPSAMDPRTAFWMKRTREQDFSRPDRADAETLNRIIWFSVRGDSYPEDRVAHLPAFDLLRMGLRTQLDDKDKDQEEVVERRPEPRSTAVVRR